MKLMNKKAQLEELSIFGIIGALLGFGIGVLIAQKMGNGVLIRMLVGAVVAVVCYFMAQAIENN